MPLAQALYTGITGISVNSDNMSVIANNIANANAVALKETELNLKIWFLWT